MTIEFRCPVCSKLLRTSDEKAGLTAKCPGCGEAVHVPEPTTSDDPFANSDAGTAGSDAYDDDEWGTSEGDALGSSFTPVPTVKMRDCPVCGASISVNARACPKCGEALQSSGTQYGFTPTKIEAGEVFSNAWRIFKDNIGICIGIVLLGGLINYVAGLPLNIGMQVIGANGGANDGVQIAIAVIVFIVLYVINIGVNWWIMLGQHIAMLKIARGEPAEISDLFKGGPYLLRMCGNSIVLGLMAGVAFLCLIVPGILVMLMFWPYIYVLIDRDLPGLESLWKSKEITQDNWGAAFLLGLIAFLLMIGGLLALCVGLIFTIPLVSLMFAVAYLMMTGQQLADSTPRA